MGTSCKELRSIAHVSPASLSKEKNNGTVTTAVFVEICSALQRNTSDNMEVVPEDMNGEKIHE